MDMDDLVLTPFKEIVEKAATAADNAGDDNPNMLKSSQALLKEGQRALKKIEPLCRRHFEEYGSNFTDALKENDEIAQYRTELNDSLWEFDEFIEVDEFDADEFAKLQKLSRKAAPRVYDIIIKMKLEPILKEERPAQGSATDSSKSSPAKERPAILANGSRGDIPNGLPPLLTSMKRGRSGRSTPTAPLPGPPPRRSLPVTPVDTGPAEFPVPPIPPNINPWDIKTKPGVNGGLGVGRIASLPERRRPAAPTPADLAQLPQIDPHTIRSQDAQQLNRYSQAMSEPQQTNAHPVHDTQQRYSQPTQATQRLSQPQLSPASTTSSQPMNESPTLGTALPAVVHVRPRMLGFPPSSHRPLDHSIPEHSTVNGNGHVPTGTAQYVDQHTGGQSLTATNLSQQQSTDSFRSSVHGSVHGSIHGGNSSPGDNRASTHSAHESSSVGSPVFSQAGAAGTPATPRDSAGLQPAAIVSRDNEGLIPVEADSAEVKVPNLPPRDTSITLSSSFYVLKGFCEGAKEVMRGELGVKQVKKPAFSGSQLTAKCTHCFYELDWKEIQLDINQSSDANFAIGNAGFRIRFLQKSHLPTRRADEPLYACVFCIQEGHTNQDGDATVFFSQRELCEHLARHRRPLPHVPGITVVDEPQMPIQMRTSYDVHLKAPPIPTVLDDKWGEIALLPTATAKETVKKMYGMKLLHDRTPAFELATGARIIGVTFPDKYMGEWCMGYHDGKYASFPFDVATLDPPPPHELKMGGVSVVRAVARWKFVIKGKTKAEWLRFDKGDTISNINWPDPDHWCWSGTNSKGKWGIFPKSHLDPKSLRENDDSDRSSTLSGGIKPKSLLGRMTSRRSDDRPETPAGSPSTKRYSRGS